MLYYKYTTINFCLNRFICNITSKRHLSQEKIKKFGKQDVFYYEKSNLLPASKQPLAIVVGWTGSTDHNVLKYKQIYSDRGFNTIRLAVSPKFTLLSRDAHSVYAHKLLNLIENECQLSNSPIVLHTLSVPGLLIYRYMSEIVHNTEKHQFLKKNLKVLVCDGSPGLTVPVSVLTDSMQRTLEHTIKQKLVRYLAATFYSRLTYNFTRTKYYEKFVNSLINDKLQPATLVYLTKNDRFVDYTTTIEFINKRKQNASNAIIDQFLFEDTDHVSHYIKYKDIYLNKLNEHLTKYL